jgi:PAS domain S-box-containing protein
MADMAKMDSFADHPLKTRSLIWIGLGFGVVFYSIDVLIDTYLFHRGDFLDQLLHPDPHKLWIRSCILLLCIAFAVYTDNLIRKFRATARKAQTAEKFLNSIIDNIPAMIFIKDAQELRFVRVNAAGEELLGLTTPKLIGRNDHDLFPQAQADFFTAKDREVLKAGTVLTIPEEEIDTRLHGKRVLHTRKVPVLDDSGQPAFLLGISDDITDIKRTQEELQQHQQELAHITRLSTLGEMATGIAHELNQPLTAISSYCESALALLKLQPKIPQSLSEIVNRTAEQTHRAAAIIRQLRDFTDKRKNTMELVDIDAVVQKSIRLLDWELRNTRTEIRLQMDTGETRILANEVQIEQVIVNLVRNALEAIRDAGVSDGEISIQSRLLPNERVRLCVSDNGPGVSAAMVGHLFDAFQSTKPYGTGIGLSVSRSIIESHGGKLWLERERHDGAVFCFTLPAQGVL